MCIGLGYGTGLEIRMTARWELDVPVDVGDVEEFEVADYTGYAASTVATAPRSALSSSSWFESAPAEKL